MSLIVDWCGYDAAKYAVEKWHYSGTLPVSKMNHLGVWENGGFIGAVIFALGATPTLGNPYGLTMWQCSELVRVALTQHDAPVSQIVTMAIKKFKRKNTGIRLLVSFADPRYGHTGTIYQAMNWIYAGTTTPVKTWRVNGEIVHRRAYTGVNYGMPRMSLPADAEVVELPGKHRYLYPLDRAMRKRLDKMEIAQPYPKDTCGGLNGSGSEPTG